MALNLFDIVHAIHLKGYTHGGIKPRNLRFDGNSLHLIDFLKSKEIMPQGQPMEYSKDYELQCDLEYASLWAHNGDTPHCRDDLVAVGFTVLSIITDVIGDPLWFRDVIHDGNQVNRARYFKENFIEKG